MPSTEDNPKKNYHLCLNLLERMCFTVANCKEKVTEKMKQQWLEYLNAINKIGKTAAIPEEAYRNVDIFAERLGERIAGIDITRNEFARRLGVSAQNVNDLLAGKRKEIGHYTLILSAAVLGCSPHYLVGLIDDPFRYLDRDGGKPIWIPFVPGPMSSHKMLEAFRHAAENDPVFADCILQVVLNGKTKQATELLLAGRVAERREPITYEIWPEYTPQTTKAVNGETGEKE